MRSARSTIAAVALVAVAAGLAGCVTTQRRNERAKVRATRLLTSRKPVDVAPRHPDARVRRVALVRGRGGQGAAIVVEVANPTARALTDLPLAVGVRARRGGATRWLNRRGGLDYLETHVASIPPRTTARWVLTTRARLPHGTRPVAAVGVPAPRLGATPEALPRLDVQPAAATAVHGTLRVVLRNRSDIPQYGLPVYAVADRDGRYVAAARATVEHVGSAGAATVQLHLVGRTAGAHVQAEALPSIFR